MTIVSGTYKLTLEEPNGNTTYMAWKVSEDELKNNPQVDFITLLTKRLTSNIERVLRNETIEQRLDRIEKEYEEHTNAV